MARKQDTSIGSVSREPTFGHLVLEGAVVARGYTRMLKKLGFTEIYRTPTIRTADFVRPGRS